MILRNVRNILITLTIVKVNAFYPFGPKEILDQSRNNDCFKIGENGTNDTICKKFSDYYLPRTNIYSDFMSFSSWVTTHIIGNDSLSQHLREDGCNSNASSLQNREEILCSFLVYDSIQNNRCQENKKNNPPYICNTLCSEYAKNLENICPASSHSKVGLGIIKNACNNFKICNVETNKNKNSKNTGISFNSANNNGNQVTNESNVASNVKSNETPGNNVGLNTNDNTNLNSNIGNIEENGNINENGLNNLNNTSSTQGIVGKENSARNNNGNMNGKDNSIDNNVNNSNNVDNIKAENDGPNKNILYTLGFMVPMSLFIGIGILYYRRKVIKSYEFEKANLSINPSSNHSSTQNMSEHSFSSGNSNINGHNKVFSIGFTDPKNVSINIPITNKNIDSREQDTLARNRVAELISTATMINAANNGYNNIQPISPNEVNININTTSRYNTLNSNASNSSLSNSYNRKLPSYIINKTNDNSSLNVNINKQTNTLKVQLPTQLNALSPTSPESEISPIIDLSMSENDPLLCVKKTNSFYHSSVSSESKKYNSFLSPISPIMSERSYENSNEINKDGIRKEKQYTNHLLTKSILEANKNIEMDEEKQNEEDEDKINDMDIEGNELLEVEDSNLRPSKIFSADLSDINKVDANSSSPINNGISVTVDDVDSRSSKYTSAKIPLSVMTVVQEFEPRMEDELKLQINDRILLLKLFDDGWAVGLNQMTGKQGVFPMEYVVSSELIKSTNKFASQIEFRNVLPSRTQSQAFANFSFTSTTMNDSVIHLTDSDFDVSTMTKTQSISSNKYYAKNSMVDTSRKSKLNTQSIIEEE